MEPNNGDQMVKTTEKSLEIIDIVQNMEGATISDLENSLSLSRSTVHKHLSTLKKNGYLQKDGNKYHIGPRFLSLGEYVKSNQRIIQLAEEIVTALADETGEEAVFAIEDRGRLITACIENHEKPDINNRRVGTYHYLHNNAGGKAILAEYSDNRVEEIVDRWGLSATTENTITTREELFDEIEIIRNQGYAVNDREFIDGLRAIGGAVHYPNGSVAGSLSISGPAYRLKTDLLHNDLKEELLDAITKLEAEAVSQYVSR